MNSHRLWPLFALAAWPLLACGSSETPTSAIDAAVEETGQPTQNADVRVAPPDAMPLPEAGMAMPDAMVESDAMPSSPDGFTSPPNDASQTAAPRAPVMVSVSPMHGGIHVFWTNTEPACDEVSGERKDATNAYAVAFSVPGDADNKHDSAVTSGVTYTYRLRCKKGGEWSDYSNEKSAKP